MKYIVYTTLYLKSGEEPAWPSHQKGTLCWVFLVSLWVFTLPDIDQLAYLWCSLIKEVIKFL